MRSVACAWSAKGEHSPGRYAARTSRTRDPRV
jgi:hypothetical protein